MVRGRRNSKKKDFGVSNPDYHQPLLDSDFEEVVDGPNGSGSGQEDGPCAKCCSKCAVS